MAIERFEPGAVVIAEGAPPDRVGRVIDGEAEVLMRQGATEVVIGTIAAGDYVGEMAALEGRSHGATVRAAVSAAGPLTMELFAAGDFLAHAVGDAALALRLLTRMSARLHRLNGVYAAAVGGAEPVAPAVAEPPLSEFQVVLNAGSAALSSALAGLPAPLPLPFSVGRRPWRRESPADEEVSLQLDDESPFRLSRAHFSIYRGRRNIYVRDLNSHLGTEVNGESIGLQFAEDVARLHEGENVIVAGGHGSPFVFQVTVAA